MSGRSGGWRVPLGLATVALLSANPLRAAEPVDVELVLAVDVSLSMSPDELEIQRKGYAAALTHDLVLQAIAEGAYGKIAVTYFEWAGSTSHHIIVPWTVIASREDAERVAARLSAQPPNSARRTSVSAALDFGADLFAESEYRGMKRVIDISGDGPNNQGPPVDATRDMVVGQGITINGLPLMTSDPQGARWRLEDLDVYYARCVIGGPGAFVVPVTEWRDFTDAVTRKLVLEIAGTWPERLLPAQAAAPYDCRIGEKMWRDNRDLFDLP